MLGQVRGVLHEGLYFMAVLAITLAIWKIGTAFARSQGWDTAANGLAWFVTPA